MGIGQESCRDYPGFECPVCGHRRYYRILVQRERSASLSNIILWLLRLFHHVYRPVPIHTKRKAERGKLRIVELRPSGQGKVDPMSNILIGTASWTDKSLIASGRFYPPKCNTPEERLRYYASQFPLVEVDSSYYAMPKPEVAQLWAERTPPNFTFNIKAFRLFTGHQTSTAALPKDVAEALGPVEKRNLYYKDLPREITDEMWRQYREGIEPLKRSGKLAAVHFQFAPWVAYHPKNRDHIEECQRQLEGYQLAIEFRNKTWFEGKHAAVTLAFERERNLVNVIVDEPQGMANTIPSVWEVTNPALAIVRLHGRNHETWNKKGLTSSAERFNYDYNDDELAELGKKIEAITAASVHVVLNNNYEDQGQRNARTLMGLVGRSRVTNAD